jgi:hypothetical protein
MVGRSSKRFMERAGLVPTVRKPMSTVNLGALRLRDYPVAKPLPIPDYLGNTQGNPPPDRTSSRDWPVQR